MKHSVLKNVIKIIICICYFSLSQLGWVSSAQAATSSIQWQGLAGYSVTATYSYEELPNGQVIHEQGRGFTNKLKALQVQFYDSTGQLIYQHDDIKDGVSQGKYFELNLDPTTQEISGRIDIGGENTEELFLRGTVNEGLSLMQIDASGEEFVLDHD